MLSDNIFILDIHEKRSSLIRRLEYNEYSKILRIYFRKYYTDYLDYEDVYPNHFKELAQQNSIGKFYLQFIKPNFKQIKNKTMADEKRKIPTKNQASDKERWIDMTINVREILKQWIYAGEKGDYLTMSLRMLPDGQTDKYGNLGMIVQKVPKEIYDAAEKERKGSGKEIKGPILGNACEFDWGNRNSEGSPGTSTGSFISGEHEDDLPF